MQLKENLCICSTAYQCFNILGLCRSEINPKETDLIIIDFTGKILDQLNNSFLKVFFNSIEIIKIKPKNDYIKLLKALVFTRFSKPIIYKKIFTYGTEINSRLISLQYYHKRYSHLFYFEDGLESYDCVLSSNVKSIKDIGFKFLYGKTPLELCEALYVYEPNVVINNSYNKKVLPIKKITNKSDEIENIIKNAFRGNNIAFPKKIVFLEAWFSEKEKYELQQLFISILEETVETGVACLKKHPNDRNNFNFDTKLPVINDFGSFEVKNFFCSMNDYIFVSIISTACLTPKLIYDEEPTVIFLYKIFLNHYIYEEWIETDKVIRRIRSSYKKPERIMIPENIEEYRECLKKIRVC